MKRFLHILIYFAAIKALAQINSFPATEGFESDFNTGTNIEFMPNWVGNTVNASSRIFQSSDSRTGSGALAVKPISSFDGEIMINLDLTLRENAQISFYARSNKNGSTSTRPALVYLSTSVDGGLSFGSNTQIGDESTFPNLDGETYNLYSYNLDAESDGAASVVVRILVERGPGSGSSAEFVMDDVEITADVSAGDTDPPIVLLVEAILATEVDVIFNENVDAATGEDETNYVLNGGIAITDAIRDDTNNAIVHLTTSELTNGETYTITISNVEDENDNTIDEQSESVFEYLLVEVAIIGDIVINEFHAAPSSTSGVPNTEFIELFNISNKFIDLENWTISDANGTSSVFNSTILRPDEYLIVVGSGDGSLFTSYGDVLEVSGWRTLNNSGDDLILQDNSGIAVFETSYTSSDSGVSTELINPNGPDYSKNNYDLSINENGGTPSEQNSIFDDTPDKTPPTIQGITILSATELELTFNEPVEEFSSEDIGNYSINGDFIVGGADRDDEDNTIVRLTVSPLISGELRTLTVNIVNDLSGNAIAPNSSIDFEFIETEIAAINDIVINEFYPIPDGESLIPNTEFVELYNRSDKFFDLKGWTLNDGVSSSREFNSFILRPGNYVIITSNGEGALFDILVDVVEVSSFPSLNNSGDDMSIEDNNGIVIHRASYTEASSGSSIELINPNGPDYSKNNYGISIDSDGGTPGAQNSIFDDTPDTTSPLILSIDVISSLELEVTFDEPLEVSSAEIMDNYSIDGGITVDGVTRDDDDNAIVHLTVSTLPSAVTRTLTINNVTDLSGNAIATNSTIDFEYIETEEAEVGDVVVNEFHANPTDESMIPNAEFIELLNLSDKYIDLVDWTLSDASGTSSAFSSYILTPDAYVILTEEDNGTLFDSYGEVLEVNGFPSLNNGGDDITLINESATTIFETSYSSTEGSISTELINPNGPDYSSNNYGFSTSVDGGTPGTQNSIFDDTPDTTLPTIQGITVLSSIELDLMYDEPVEETSAEDIGNYSIDGGITVDEVTRNDEDNAIVHLTVSTLPSVVTRTLTINNVKDLSGNAIAINSTIDFEYIETEEAEVGDVVVNEFHASPTEGSMIPNAEFVELLNLSDKYIDLVDWILSDGSGSSSAFPSYVLGPGSYVILTEVDNEPLFSNYGDVLEVPGFPSLNNGGDAISITDASTLTIFETSYLRSEDGISTELINPNGPDFSLYNYGISIANEGGTPGVQNSIFDDTPDTTPPSLILVEVVDENNLEITFSEPLEETEAEILTNYSIDGGIDAITVQLVEDVRVLLKVSTLISTEVRTLTVINLVDLSGNMIETNTMIDFEYVTTESAEEGDVIINEFLSNPADNRDDFVELYNRSQKYISLKNWRLNDESSTSEKFANFILRPTSYVIIHDEDANINYPAFGDAIAIPSLTLNNSNDQIQIVDSLDNQIAFLIYSDIEEGRSMELVNPDDPCISALSYEPSADLSGGTPGIENSVFDPTADTRAPSVVSFGYDGTFTIHFSEVMEATSLLEGIYNVDGLTITVLPLDDFPSSVELNFSEELVKGASYSMLLSKQGDCSGNEITPTEITFGLGRAPQFNELIISEIMFDPSPSFILPDREFIELHNPTTDIIATSGMKLMVSEDEVELPSVNIDPGSYLVLTGTSAIEEFQSNGLNISSVIGVPGFPSLNNSGEWILLKYGDQLITSLLYSSDWHTDETKKQGGWTLEMIDITNPCLDSELNWASSEALAFGTPGAVNSISAAESIPDNFGPAIENVVALSTTRIKVEFDEKIDPSTVSQAVASFIPSADIASYSFELSQPSTFFINLAKGLSKNQPNTVTLNYLTDCSGNKVGDQSFTFSLPVEAETGDVLLSEVLFNPKTGGVDFVEIFNNSDNYVSLKNWRLARITDLGISDERMISEAELVLNPGSFLAITTDPEVLLATYSQSAFEHFWKISSLPIFANDTGNVVLLNSAGQLYEFFHYEDDYHYDLLESTDGVSLERVSYDDETNDPNNWRSASSTAGFATPGYANSQSYDVEVPTGKVEVEPKVFIPSNSGSGRDFTTINYQFDQPGNFANITIYDQTGRLVKNITEGALLSSNGFVRWDGTTNTGQMARIGYYIILFELFNSSGNTEVIKETVVVGRDF